MNVLCVGSGPAGLLFAILCRALNPGHALSVIEREADLSERGWGIVLSAGMLETLDELDTACAQSIRDGMRESRRIETRLGGRDIRTRCQPFFSMSRHGLLGILHRRCTELGIPVHFESPFALGHPLVQNADLIVAADGAHSTLRQLCEQDLLPKSTAGACEYLWLGTRKRFDALTFIYENTPDGWFHAHAYQFDADTSTFVIEARSETLAKANLGSKTPAETVIALSALFSSHLDGHPLLLKGTEGPRTPWRPFMHVSCNRRAARLDGRPVVFIGDAAETLHFSIGSGTKAAFLGALQLAKALRHRPRTDDAVSAILVDPVDRAFPGRMSHAALAARMSCSWFEHIADVIDLPPLAFTYSLLNRSLAIPFERLSAQDGDFADAVVQEFCRASNVPEQSCPMEAPLHVGSRRLDGRILLDWDLTQKPPDLGQAALCGIPVLSVGIAQGFTRPEAVIRDCLRHKGQFALRLRTDSAEDCPAIKGLRPFLSDAPSRGQLVLLEWAPGGLGKHGPRHWMETLQKSRLPLALRGLGEGLSVPPLLSLQINMDLVSFEDIDDVVALCRLVRSLGIDMAHLDLRAGFAGGDRALWPFIAGRCRSEAGIGVIVSVETYDRDAVMSAVLAHRVDMICTRVSSLLAPARGHCL